MIAEDRVFWGALATPIFHRLVFLGEDGSGVPILANQTQVARARAHLLTELREGKRAPGTTISVKDTASSLGLSPTPVREALSYLAGEGIVVTSGARHGYAIPRPGVKGYVELCELASCLISAASRYGHAPDVAPIADENEPVATSEQFFGWLIAGCDNVELLRSIARTNVVLAPYRLVEPAIMSNWGVRWENLGKAVVTGRLKAALEEYWNTRFKLAPKIVAAAERREHSSNIFEI